MRSWRPWLWANLKPLLPLAAILALGVVGEWAVETQRMKLYWVAFGWPILVAAIVALWVERQLNHQRTLVGFEFTITLRDTNHHPLMRATLDRFEARYAQLPPHANLDHHRETAMTVPHQYLFHHGLIWSFRDRSYVSKIVRSGRWFGTFLGEDATPESDQEPSIVLVEHRGSLKVAIVPVERDSRRLTLWTDRQSSERNAYAALTSHDSSTTCSTSKPALIVDFPLGELARLVCAPDNVHSLRQHMTIYEAILKRSGFRQVKHDPESWTFDDPTEIESDYATIAFRRVERPFWM